MSIKEFLKKYDLSIVQIAHTNNIKWSTVKSTVDADIDKIQVISIKRLANAAKLKPHEVLEELLEK